MPAKKRAIKLPTPRIPVLTEEELDATPDLAAEDDEDE